MPPSAALLRTIAASGIAALLAHLGGCADAPDPGAGPVGSEGWLDGGSREKFATIAEHLGGFGDAMVMIGYRYSELHWAGEDRNWPYAAHQLEEMEETLELAIARRPKRAASSQHFLTVVIPEVAAAIESEDPQRFAAAFDTMTANCNACHAMEGMRWLQVRTPTVRATPWGAPR